MTVPIVALDFPTEARAMEIVEQLGDSCNFYKVGSELFTAAGPGVIKRLRERDCEVFIDLKLHDIPNTVASAMRVLAGLDVRLATVHAAGGRAMLEAAVKAAGRKCGVFAVTVLTSLDATGIAEITGVKTSTPADTVMRLAALASSCGTRGVVCSGQEAAMIRGQFGATFEMIVPGIRLQGDDAGDQSRVVTPEAATAAGADYIVVGRSVTAASDPLAAMQSIREGLTATR
ncbi:MAG TPA: orotidine-5'-phosphate decarboxylase [Gemmatimonadaceae bacterium]|nr:orotidine-5'-phosphate decarboxylase [Gemmatimonadaceae bacterium]